MTFSGEMGLVLALSYLLGSIPFGLLFTKMAGLGDIRDVGSGNIGATNVLRTGRKDLALATLIMDAGKGAIAVLLTRYMVDPALAPLAGAAAFIGHCFPIYLKFKGGKGVATFFGTVFAINPLLGLACGVTWLLAAAIFRFSSLSALIASLLAPAISYYIVGPDSWIFIAFMTLVIYIRHKENIARLMRGEEPKIGKKNK
ncbi:glycerol-3-phosphate 1-O-acyltransferase PlsY [Kordiimonas lacus]|uniref:Glycerol-3-phosphate acyltransferase n=1 Tax=Kordiimonas lacus TaxID=637679 RepID=A0A1G7C483_9PROT|nr:glycerol-3-phosphate 1-O-acyltransferase PlsY [Kordiimonas lacus]SDE34194.1 glycerol-3-phosphate acyltransferase PlsY [Kordiimonas lacus]